MSLMVGRGPFGRRPSGVFNFQRTGPDRVAYWEAGLKRYRVQVAGSVVADSRDVHLLHEQYQSPHVYFPRHHVAMDRLQPSDHRTRSPLNGEARYWSAGEAADIAWSYEDPAEDAPPIAGFVCFDLPRVDAWYEEDEKGYAHPRDPYHRVDVRRATRRVVVRHADTVIAEATRPAMLFETTLAPRFYLSPDEVRQDLFEQSETVSHCPYKGPGQHWHLLAGGVRIEDAAWTLAAPLGDATAIPDWWSFYTEKLSVEVDGEVLQDD